MKINEIAGCVLTPALVVGCSVQPTAFYQPIPTQSATYQGDWDGLSKFTLAKNELLFSEVGYEEKDAKSTKKKSWPSRFRRKRSIRILSPPGFRLTRMIRSVLPLR